MAENDRETLAEVIREELEHSEIVKRLRAFEEMSRPVTVREVTKHPLFLTVVGFLLTGAIGTWLEHLYSNRVEQQAERTAAIDRARAEEVESQKAFWATEGLTSRRLTAGSMLRSAIKRDSPKEVIDRKAVYDAAYMEWNNEMMRRLIELRRQVINPDGEPFVTGSVFEQSITEVILPVLTGIDGCLTKAYDAYRTAENRAPGFVCPGQPDTTCAGLTSADVTSGSDLPAELEAAPGTLPYLDRQTETTAVEKLACKDYWWDYVQSREGQVRKCFNALSTDAFLYFRARTRHQIAIARQEESDVPNGSVRVFMEECGDALGEDVPIWQKYLEVSGHG